MTNLFLAEIAQLEEPLTCNQVGAGSIPALGSIVFLKRIAK